MIEQQLGFQISPKQGRLSSKDSKMKKDIYPSFPLYHNHDEDLCVVIDKGVESRDINPDMDGYLNTTQL